MTDTTQFELYLQDYKDNFDLIDMGIVSEEELAEDILASSDYIPLERIEKTARIREFFANEGYRIFDLEFLPY